MPDAAADPRSPAAAGSVEPAVAGPTSGQDADDPQRPASSPAESTSLSAAAAGGKSPPPETSRGSQPAAIAPSASRERGGGGSQFAAPARLPAAERSTRVLPAGQAAGGASGSGFIIAGDLRGASDGSSTQLGIVAVSRGATPIGHAAVDPALLDDQVTIISTRGPIDNAGIPQGLAPLEVGRRLEGERLGQFVLQKFVGGGGMGAVFRALDTTLNREVAVKVLSRFQSDEEETLRRFRNEAQSAARLDHVNIARVYYVGCDRGLHYIVFEFIEGENVRNLVERKGPLPVVEAVSYTLQIAEALTHASQRDVIHRDIKPSNVLVTPEGKAKLVDMGLARLHIDQADQDITASGVTLGTFDYISPEQARDPRLADVRSDLYSLGCSMFFMLTGQPPFPHGTVLQKLLQHQGDEPPDAKTLRPDLPADVHRVLNRLLAKDPDDRFQSPTDLILELLAAGRSLGLQPPSSVNVDWSLPAERPIPWWEKHLPWFVPLAALVTIVVALDYFWSTADARSQPQASLAENAREVSSEAANAVAVKPRRQGSPAPRDRAAVAASNAIPGNLSAKKATAAGPARDPVAGAASGAPNSAQGREGINGRGVKPPDRAPAPDASRSPSLATDGAGGERGPSSGPPATERGDDGSFVAGSTDLATPRSSNRTEVGGANGAPLPIPMPGVALGAVEATSPVEAPPPQGLLIVGETDGRIPSFTTLAAACSAAKSGDVIELRYSGVSDEHPIWLSNLKLTIRAGERYAPVVRFRPTASDAEANTRNMISVVGGQLNVMNVRFEFDLPRPAMADDWAFCAVQRAERLRFEQCVFSIRNAGFGQTSYTPNVAFFRVQAPSGATSLVYDNAEDRVPELQLQNCVARGEATFLDIVDGEGARLEWQNGFLATSECLLGVRTPADSQQLGGIELDVKHLTAVVRGGLALLDVSERGIEPGPPVQIALADSIVALPAMASAPLIDTKIADRAFDFRSRLSWSGDRNFYQGFDAFWRISAVGSDDSLDLSHADWEATWGESHEYLCRSGGVRWQALSAPSAPFDSLAPGDYALLADGRMNPAVASASDGRDAGYLSDGLPAVPSGASKDVPKEVSPHGPGPSETPAAASPAPSDNP